MHLFQVYSTPLIVKECTLQPDKIKIEKVEIIIFHPVRAAHKLLIYTEYRTKVYVPSSELGLSQPLSRQRVWGWESQLRRLEKSLALCRTLWCCSLYNIIAIIALIDN